MEMLNDEFQREKIAGKSCCTRVWLKTQGR